MAKKNLTIKQQAKRYGLAKRAFFSAEFLSALMPMFIYVIVNDSQYFVEYEGVKFSVAFFLAIVLVGISIIGVSGEKVKGTLLGFALKVGVALAIVMLAEELIFELKNLLVCLFFGLLGSCGFEIGNKKFEQKQKAKLESIKIAKQENDVEQAKEELKGE